MDAKICCEWSALWNKISGSEHLSKIKSAETHYQSEFMQYLTSIKRRYVLFTLLINKLHMRSINKIFCIILGLNIFCTKVFWYITFKLLEYSFVWMDEYCNEYYLLSNSLLMESNGFKPMMLYLACDFLSASAFVFVSYWFHWVWESHFVFDLIMIFITFQSSCSQLQAINILCRTVEIQMI